MNTSIAQLEQTFGNLRSLFQQADVDGDGVLSPNEALRYFPRFQLPTEVLSTIWSSTVAPNAPGMSYTMFVNAMRLIYQAKMSSSQPLPPQNGIGDSSMLKEIPPNFRKTYEHNFSTLQRHGKISKQDCMKFYGNSNLNSSFLNQIWNLIDVGSKGAVSKEEFCWGMFLIHSRMKNPQFQLPSVIPALKSNVSTSSSPVVGNPQVSQYQSLPVNGNNTERLDHLEAEKKNLQNQTYQTESALNQTKLRYNQVKNQEELLKEGVEQLLQELQNLQKQKMEMENTIEEKSRNIQQLHEQKNSFMTRLPSMRQEIFRLESIYNQVKGQEKSLSDEVNGLASGMASELDTFEKLTEELQTIKDDIQNATIDKNEKEKEAQNEIQKMKHLYEELRTLKEKNRELQSKVLEQKSKQQVYSLAQNRISDEIEKEKDITVRLEKQLTDVKNIKIGDNSSKVKVVQSLRKQAERILFSLNQELKGIGSIENTVFEDAPISSSKEFSIDFEDDWNVDDNMYVEDNQSKPKTESMQSQPSQPSSGQTNRVDDIGFDDFGFEPAKPPTNTSKQVTSDNFGFQFDTTPNQMKPIQEKKDDFLIDFLGSSNQNPNAPIADDIFAFDSQETKPKEIVISKESKPGSKPLPKLPPTTTESSNPAQPKNNVQEGFEDDEWETGDW